MIVSAQLLVELAQPRSSRDFPSPSRIPPFFSSSPCDFCYFPIDFDNRNSSRHCHSPHQSPLTKAPSILDNRLVAGRRPSLHHLFVCFSHRRSLIFLATAVALHLLDALPKPTPSPGDIYLFVDTDEFEEEYEDGEITLPHVIVGRDLSRVRNSILRMIGSLET
ncbi:hypothetical protein Patl1_17349 [Pistacia atlantica]|uniref:Uncharacterized protein n=1 Tax=Pistacia atlantica TaxID=434234 RepID=A0ACC1C171_9ROSI|nr:hypothetical protein Patl1_17349 [Pistacia atlantica]